MTDKFDFDNALAAIAKGQQIEGKDGVLMPLIKQLVEASLKAELSHHLNEETKPNRKNGTTKKSLKTLDGTIELETPRDRAGTFKPKLVKNQTRLTDQIDRKILSMFARGMSYRDIKGHIADMYALDVYEVMISTVTDQLIPELKAWQQRPLDAVYPFIWLDAIHYKIKEEGHYINDTHIINFAPEVAYEKFIPRVDEPILEPTLPEYEGYSPTTKEILFAAKHPIIAWEIGAIKDDSTNISTNSHRFASAGESIEGNHPLQYRDINKNKEGTQVNVARHVLWQAMITNRYDAEIAKEVGDSHEKNPLARHTDQRSFKTLTEADQVIDLLNNEIGRRIGERLDSDTDMKQLALTVLEEFYGEGLYTARQDKNGDYMVEKTKITTEQHEFMKQEYDRRDAVHGKEF